MNNEETPVGIDHIREMVEDKTKTIADLQKIEIECGGSQE